MVGAGFELGLDLVEFTATDEIFNGMSGAKDFAFGKTNAEIWFEAKALGNDGDERISELGGNAILNFAWESENHSLERFDGGCGMDGGHDEVAGLGSVERETHGFWIAHFADHEDVGVFAKGVEEGLLEGGRVTADFALAEE